MADIKEGHTKEESEEEDDEMLEQELRQGKVGKEDAVVSTVEFRNWRALTKATQSIIQTVTELIQLTNTDDDEDFEEIDDEEGGAAAEETKNDATTTTLPTAFISRLAFANLEAILKRAQAIPQFLGLTQETEENLDEVQEAAFKFIVAALQTFKAQIISSGNAAQVLEMITKVIDVSKDFMDKNLYKCERNVFEAILSLLRYLLQNYSVELPDIKVNNETLNICRLWCSRK